MTRETIVQLMPAIAASVLTLSLSHILEFVKACLRERKKKKLSHAITLINQILDGSGFGDKDRIEGSNQEPRLRLCVPMPWIADRASELMRELEALGIRSPNMLGLPARSHLIGYLFIMRGLLEDINVNEARRFGQSFCDTLEHHPWDADGKYLTVNRDNDGNRKSSSLTDTTAIQDDFVNSSPT